MELLVIGIVAFFFIVMMFSGFSKSSSLKRQFKDGLAELTTYAGETIKGAGSNLKASSIESQIKKINLGVDFNVRYQDNDDGTSVIFMFSSLKDSYYKMSEVTNDLKKSLIESGNNNDLQLIKNIEDSHDLYKKFKELNIETLNVRGSEISYSDNAKEKIKTGKTIKLYKLGDFGFLDRTSL